MREKIFTLKMNGYCCSQIIMEIGLEKLGRENDDLIEAMAGLCDGVKRGKICGAASAAVCLMYLTDSRAAESGLVEELLDWFEDAFGTLECEELIGDRPMEKLEKCRMIVESTLMKLEELLEWE